MKRNDNVKSKKNNVTKGSKSKMKKPKTQKSSDSSKGNDGALFYA